MKCICMYCKKEFEVKYPSKKRKFCSKSCAQYYRWQNTKRNTIKFNCEICGKEFYVPISDNRLKNGQTIKYCSHQCAGVGIRKGKYIKCKNCGKEFYTTRHTFCSQQCFREYKKKNYLHKNYFENGYICQYIQGYNKKGNAKQHRLIMEEYLGRKLEKNEVVHHKNGIKTDNRIENLEVMTISQHNSYHRKKELENGKKLFKSNDKN